MRCSDLAALLQEYSEAGNLPRIERALARNAIEWLQLVSLEPTREWRFRLIHSFQSESAGAHRALPESPSKLITR